MSSPQQESHPRHPHYKCGALLAELCGLTKRHVRSPTSCWVKRGLQVGARAFPFRALVENRTRACGLRNHCTAFVLREPSSGRRGSNPPESTWQADAAPSGLVRRSPESARRRPRGSTLHRSPGALPGGALGTPPRIVGMTGIAPAASCAQGTRSTTELHPVHVDRQGLEP